MISVCLLVKISQSGLTRGRSLSEDNKEAILAMQDERSEKKESKQMCDKREDT